MGITYFKLVPTANQRYSRLNSGSSGIKEGREGRAFVRGLFVKGLRGLAKELDSSGCNCTISFNLCLRNRSF